MQQATADSTAAKTRANKRRKAAETTANKRRKAAETREKKRLKARENIPSALCLLSDFEMSAALGISRSTWWREVRAGRFPKPRNPSAGCTRWTLAELEEIVENTGEASDKAGHRNHR